MGMGVVLQHYDTSREYAEMFSLDGGMKVSEGSTIVLYTDGDATVFDEYRHQQSVDAEENNQHNLSPQMVGS
jgi:hypothetical protein